MRTDRRKYWHERVEKILLHRASLWCKWFAPAKHLRFPHWHRLYVKTGMALFDARDRDAGRPLEQALEQARFRGSLLLGASYYGA